MRDLDEIQEHEVKQQRLVERIVNDLHRATQDDDGYAAKFRDLAICIIYNLDRQHALTHDYDKSGFYTKIVESQISEFVQGQTDDTERKFLLCQVLDKVTASGTQPYRQSYSRKQLAA